MNEVSHLCGLSHPNVLQFHNWYETRNHLWVIVEYCAGGDIGRLLKQDLALPEATVRCFGRDICAGLLYLHCRGVVYGDLKPANLLYTEAGVLKLCDFGLATRLDDLYSAASEDRPMPRRGTPSPRLQCSLAAIPENKD